jgi:hypothetical protein
MISGISDPGGGRGSIGKVTAARAVAETRTLVPPLGSVKDSNPRCNRSGGDLGCSLGRVVQELFRHEKIILHGGDFAGKQA